MSAAKNDSSQSRDPAPLVITRDFNAPRNLVFEAWSKAEHLEKWFGPDGFKVTCVMDFRVGGKLDITMDGHGMKHTVYGIYRDIAVPEKIEWVFRFEDLPDHEIPTTVTFEARGDTTRLTVKQVFPQWVDLTAAQQAILRPRVMGSSMGWGQTLDHLGKFVQR